LGHSGLLSPGLSHNRTSGSQYPIITGRMEWPIPWNKPKLRAKRKIQTRPDHRGPGTGKGGAQRGACCLVLRRRACTTICWGALLVGGPTERL